MRKNAEKGGDGEGAVGAEGFVKNPKKDDGYGECRSGRVT